ncbi:hypothetical protein E4U43_000769 [Claviceps pusilla]|uniref:Uncharacterized protein n=1 Tax=Claviceps pusilla TaxID=123648 RepID=A0A9P7NB00_9HYPO|nr:hypothetical protein E4U43_000769 [Claviceps pusilla]
MLHHRTTPTANSLLHRTAGPAARSIGRVAPSMRELPPQSPMDDRMPLPTEQTPQKAAFTTSTPDLVAVSPSSASKMRATLWQKHNREWRVAPDSSAFDQTTSPI